MTSGRSVPTSASASAPSDGLADDLEVRVAGEHPAEAVADDRVVVDDQHPDRAHRPVTARPPPDPAAIAGTRAETAVPPPGSDSIASEPATRATRWRIPVRPNPAAVARAALGDGEARRRRRGRRASRRRP